MIVNSFKYPQVSAVGGAVDIEFKNFRILTDNLSMFHEQMTLQTPGTRRLLASLNIAIIRQAFQAIQGFDERYPLPADEDSDLSIRVYKPGNTLFFEPMTILLHVPPRSRFQDLIHHSFNQGRFSLEVNPRYIGDEVLLGLLRTRWVHVLATPIRAAVTTVRIFSKMDILLRYLLSAPFEYIAKIAWFLGATKYSFRSNDRSPRNSLNQEVHNYVHCVSSRYHIQRSVNNDN